MAVRIGPTIPGLGVNYTSPATTPKSTAVSTLKTASAPGFTIGADGRPIIGGVAAGGQAAAPRPASANSALGLGSPAQSVVPPSLSSQRAPAPQPTLIPAALDAAGRAGGANASTTTTSTGAVRATPPVPSINDSDYARTPGANLPGGTTPIPGAPAPGQQGGGQQGGSSPAPRPSGAGAQAPGGGSSEPGLPATGGGTSRVDAAAALEAAINQLLDPEFIGFQGDRAAELRRLQNLRNQLFGDAEMGQTGSVQRQQDLDAQSRRRLAAQRAMSGMLQGGAYAGTERGLGTLQRANQDMAMQEMLRPFREQTAADRLREFGLSFDPGSRVFDQMDLDMQGFTTQTQAGRAAAARARQQAIQQLAQRGIQI